MQDTIIMFWLKKGEEAFSLTKIQKEGCPAAFRHLAVLAAHQLLAHLKRVRFPPHGLVHAVLVGGGQEAQERSVCNMRFR